SEPTGLYGSNRRLRQRLDIDEPLRREVGLNDGLAAVTLPYRHFVVFDLDQQTTIFQRLLNFGPGFCPGKSAYGGDDVLFDSSRREAGRIEQRLMIEDGQAGKLMPFT